MNLLSALSAVGSMRLEEFYQIVQFFQCDASDYDIRKTRRDLSALGHIDVNYSTRRVQVCAPRLCILPHKNDCKARAVLSGARNGLFLKQLEKTVGKHAVKMKREQLVENCPERILIEGDFVQFQQLVASMQNPPLIMSGTLEIPDAWAPLHSLQSLIDRLQSHSETRAPAGAGQGGDSWRVFLPKESHPRLWEEVKRDYPYNLALVRKTPYTHWLARRTPDGAWEYWQNGFQGDCLWAKWAVAQSGELAGLFDQGIATEFRVPSWLPLPIELHRVCCLCTGLLPSATGGWIVYSDVPHIIQHYVREKLSLGLFCNTNSS